MEYSVLCTARYKFIKIRYKLFLIEWNIKLHFNNSVTLAVFVTLDQTPQLL